MNANVEERKTFVSSKGIELKLLPVSQFKLDALRTSFPDIPVPQYQMTIAGGTKVNHPLDETIAKNQGRMEEWLKYKQDVERAKAEKSQRYAEFMIWEGVEVDVPGMDSDWQKTADHFGIPIPEEPIARKLQYVFEMLVGQDDVAALISQIFSVSQVDQEVVAKIRNSFRINEKRNADKPTGKNSRKVEKPKPDV